MQKSWQQHYHVMYIIKLIIHQKTLNYIDCTGNPCTLEYELLIYTKRNSTFLGIIRLTINNLIPIKNPCAN